MTKAEIVNEVAKSTGIEKIAVQSVIEAFMDTVKGSIIRKERRRQPETSPRRQL